MKKFKLFPLQRPKTLMFWLDLLCFLVSCCISQMLLILFNYLPFSWISFTVNLVVWTTFNMLGMIIFQNYQKLWVYARIQDLVECMLGVVCGSVVAMLFEQLFLPQMYVSSLFNLLVFLVSIIGIITVRVTGKTIYNYCHNSSSEKTIEKHPTLIIGAGVAGRMLIFEMLEGTSDYMPIGLVDDDADKIGTTIQGVPVLGSCEDLPKLAQEYHVHVILFAIPSAADSRRRQIMSICSKCSCLTKALPHTFDLVSSENLLKQTVTIRVEDLLGREPVKLNITDIEKLIKGKVCMVTGGGGSIGSELSRQIMKYQPQKLIIVDIYENNAYEIQQDLILKYGSDLPLAVEIASVRDYQKMSLLFNKYRPQLVFHAAAHKHVPLMETAPEEAVKNNVFGTFNIASLADFYQCDKFVLISSDKAVNPTNVMGATKRCCEMVVQYMAQQTTKTEFVSVRFGNVLGSNGSVIPLFRKQIENGGPVSVTHPDIIRYFMTIPEAVSLVLQAGSMAHGGEIFVLDMGEPVKIVTLAENLIRLYGYEPNVDIPIRFSGLRPGEKLYEELLMSEEGLIPTCNNKIFIGNQLHQNNDIFVEQLKHLKDICQRSDSEATIELLKEIVPTFHHKKSDSKLKHYTFPTVEPIFNTVKQ